MKEVILILLADKISMILIIIATISGLIGTVTFIMSCVLDREVDFEHESSWQILRNVGKGLLITFAISLPIAILFPRSKEIATIVGVGTVIEYARGNETIRELPDKAVIAIDRFLEEYVVGEEEDTERDSR